MGGLFVIGMRCPGVRQIAERKCHFRRGRGACGDGPAEERVVVRVMRIAIARGVEREAIGGGGLEGGNERRAGMPPDSDNIPGK